MDEANRKNNPREYMELAVTTMRNSVNENRIDKSSPLVGAVIILPNNDVKTACRGELSEGDHAEYTLLERKLSTENISGATLYVTLEPCAPGARSSTKLSCAERIVNRRIAKVWIGIEDPDPLVNGKGIKFLEEHGVAVELFDRDFQETIGKVNDDFIKGAKERASRYEDNLNISNTSDLEEAMLTASLDDLNKDNINTFIEKTPEFKFEYGSEEFYRVFIQLRYLSKIDNTIYPTGLGILLFGNNPQIFYPNAVIRATHRTDVDDDDIETFSGNLPKQAIECQKWVKDVIGKRIDRSNAQRENIYKYPLDVIRETINNALAHRSYDIEGGSISLVITDNYITVRSPGSPVKPISMEKMKNLNAPYLSKNPKITYVFEKLDLSESRGFGFTTIRSLPTKHDLPLPDVIFDDPFLIFEFSRTYDNSKRVDERLNSLSKSELKGYDYIRINSPFTRKDYEENLGVSGKTASRQINHFIELNLVKVMGSGVKTTYELI